jgi:homoserine O-succinyltransferase
MTAWLQGNSAGPRRVAGAGAMAGRGLHSTADVVDVGLVNNMPDPALTATERQFARLLDDAGQGRVRLHLFYLPGVPRSDEAKAILAERYRPVDDLYASPLDALIVTGNEPKAANLDDEPYWPELASLIDWATTNTVSTIWSCLAAHAAVLHLDRITRRKLPSKRSGVFSSAVESGGLGALPGNLVVCHSRLNEVTSTDLEAAGYQIVSQSPGGHVDTFVKDYRSRFVFFQGHPEYDVDSLMREYRRDVGRYLSGQRDIYPDVPENYFDDKTLERMLAFRRLAEADREKVASTDFPQADIRAGLEAQLRVTSSAIYRNWLAGFADGDSTRSDANRISPGR